ncbi:MAG: YdcF family protein [Gammaproteobacteria bacterium]
MSTNIVSRQLAATLETTTPLQPEISLLFEQTGSQPQAIVVLSGGHYDVMPEYGISVPQASVLERIRYAMHIQKQTELPLLISGGKVFPTSKSEAWIMNQVLLNDFKTEAKWLEEKSRNTAENARYSFDILSQEKIKHIYLVTHTSHMGRAADIFQKHGFIVTPAPTIFLSKEGDMPDLMRWLPTSNFLASSRNSLHEILGHWWYKLRHH